LISPLTFPSYTTHPDLPPFLHDALPIWSDAMPALHTGGCLCGAIRYTVDAPVATLRACHCTNCQKSSGAAGTVNAVVPSASFRIDRKSTRLNSSHVSISYAVFCLKNTND